MARGSQYLLIQMNEGVLDDVLVYSGKDARSVALGNFRALKKEAKSGEGFCDEAHLYRITTTSASGVSGIDSYYEPR